MTDGITLFGTTRGQAVRHSKLTGTAFVFIFILCLVIYFPRAATVPQPTDGPEMVTAAITGGLAHPPGYPLWTYIISAVTSNVKNPYLAASLLTAIVQALSVLFIAFTLTSLCNSVLLGGVAALSWAFLLPTLLTATDPEVFALLNLLTSIFVYLSLRETKNSLCTFLIGLMFGLGLSHHHLMVLWVPVLVWTFFSSIKKARITLSLGVLLGLLPWLLLFVRYKQSPDDSFAAVSNFSEWIIYVSRFGYGSLQLAIVDGESRGVLIEFLRYLGWTIPCLLLTSIFILPRVRDGRILCLLFSLCMQLWFVYQITVPSAAFDLFWVFRLLSGVTIPLYLLFAILLKNAPKFVFVLLLVIPQLLGISRTLDDANRSRNFAPYLGVIEWISHAPLNAVLLADSDLYSFGAAYRQKVEHQREDLKIITSGMLGSRSYRSNLRVKFPGLASEVDLQSLNKAQLINRLKELGYAFVVEPNSK